MKEKCNICNQPVKGQIVNYWCDSRKKRYVRCYDNDYDSEHWNDPTCFLICKECRYSMNPRNAKDITIPDHIPEVQYNRYLKTYFNKLIQ